MDNYDTLLALRKELRKEKICAWHVKIWTILLQNHRELLTFQTVI